jgi:hypothetical protein
MWTSRWLFRHKDVVRYPRLAASRFLIAFGPLKKVINHANVFNGRLYVENWPMRKIVGRCNEITLERHSSLASNAIVNQFQSEPNRRSQ